MNLSSEKFCIRCGAQLGVLGLCSINPGHAPADTPEEMVCDCGCMMALGRTSCDACMLSTLTDSPLVED